MYLSLKGLNAVEIHNGLAATLKGEAKSDSTVTPYLRKPSFSSPKKRQPYESPAPIPNELDEAVLLDVSEKPFASVRQLARKIHLHYFTVYNHITNELGFTVRCFRWVPHFLSEPNKHNRIQLSSELFEMLQHQKDREWHDIITLDEFWFYFATDHGRIWLPEGTEAPERERITIQSRKIMVTIVWNPTGLYQIVALPKGMKFNADYYISQILDPLAEWRRSQVAGPDRRLHVHVDNAHPRTAKKVTEFLAGNGMKTASHSSCSLDLAPCNLHLFGCIKGRLAGPSFEEPDQLLQAIDAVFRSIEKPHWNACFRSGWTDWRNVVWQLVI
jgi:hypothetical protein